MTDAIPPTMRAVVVERLGGPWELRELPVPRPGPGQVLVRMAASGVCSTDISLMMGQWRMKRPRFPLVPGHEGAGTVAALGPGVDSLAVGDRVGIFWMNGSCHRCEHCVTGYEMRCLDQVNSGYNVDGTYAEYCLVTEQYAVPLPEGDIEQLTPVMCAGVTAYRGLKELALPLGAWVLVTGVGGTGHLAIQYAKAMGWRVVAMDIEPSKVELATTLGADLAFDCSRRAPINRINQITGGVHGAFVAASSAKAYDHAFRLLRRGGTCALIGVPAEPISLTGFEMITREITVRGTIIGTRQDLREALQLVSEGKVRSIVEHRPLEDVTAAVEAMRDRRIAGRLLLTMNRPEPSSTHPEA